MNKVLLGIGITLLLLFGLGSCSVCIVQPGDVGVQVTFGSISPEPLSEGTHIVPPWSSVVRYDTKQKTLKEEQVPMPSGDQLITEFDVNVQYSIIAASAPHILHETGDEKQLVDVQLEPKLRSLLREVSKGVANAQDFFQENTQKQMQADVLSQLNEFCTPKGLRIEAILFRNITLPDVVALAVKQKVEREQKTIQQQFELTRFTTEQQQKVATAKAELDAASAKAQQTRVEADAEAYRIEAINRAASGNPVYVQLQALKTLAEMAKDPATKLFFLDGQSSTPLPLLHLDGNTVSATKAAVVSGVEK